MTLMERIESGLGKNDKDFVAAIYELFKEYRDAYSLEWIRIEDNEKMYRGDHWHDVPLNDPNEPRPVTPVIQSTIENIRADLMDEFPEAVIRPEDIGDEMSAKIMTEVVAQNLEATDYEAEYDLCTHDLLVDGWCVQETGWDKNLYNGIGGTYIRHVSNENFMSDPHCADIQDGRACFKFDKLPKEYFRQRYPKQYKKMDSDLSTVDSNHQEHSNTVTPDDNEFFILIEAWFKLFKDGKSTIHMVQVAGGQVLENSYTKKPEGYFAHGLYPFVITPLFVQKGTPLGFGIVDLFKKAQQYSDKLDQILLINSLMASRPKLLVQDSMADIDDLRDYSKSVHEVQGPPQGVAMWHNPPQLPSHVFVHAQSIRQSIKDESGSNEFSRGNVTAGVTAASAITALQEMSSKRSRTEARRLQFGFKQSVRMMLEIEREFDLYPRFVTVSRAGEPQQVVVSNAFYKQGTPIEFNISIKTMRETRFTKLANNELMLQAVNIFGQTADPIIIFEGMEFEGKELLLEKLRAAQGKGMLMMQQQIVQLQQAVAQLSAENQQYSKVLATLPEVPEALPQI